jgi:glycine/D-amino acid oxidase-like deaminating enzyme
MKTGTSPWLHQLRPDRPINHLHGDLDSDIVIVGAGIAGISTAFFILRNTDRKVVVLEKNKLAHGATGHNAGQVVTYFERPFVELVKEFGHEPAVNAQKAIEGSWELIDLMYREAGLDIPFSKFKGHAGFSSLEQVLHELEDNYLKAKGGIALEPVFIAETVDWLSQVPEKYKGLYRTEKHDVILSRLQTANSSYIAVHSADKGCVNSALFCQEVLSYLEKTYPHRFSLFEGVHVNKLVLKHDHVILDADKYTVKARRVILCTNGFENVTILNETGLDIDTKFHHLLEGKVGYMSGYLETHNKDPMAVSYYTDVDSTIKDPYFYLTRRTHEYEGKKDYNLICVGGPDVSLEDRREYVQDYDFPEEAQKQIDDFVKSTYDTDPNKNVNYQFTWHGLMGYTPNGVRLIGPEPKNPVLIYNLGCNGVGILPSIFGASRISDMIAGKKLEPMIFDPKG